MPTYDYVCRGCEHRFELFQSMKDAPKRTCPKCGKPKLERLIGTGAALLFKGSGFYQTDYRSESYSKAAKADSGGGDAKPAEPKTPGARPAPSAEKPAPAPKAEKPEPGAREKKKA